MSKLIILWFIAFSPISFADKVKNYDLIEIETQCKFTFDDAEGKFDGEVSTKIKAKSFTLKLAQLAAKEQCRQLNIDFQDVYKPDMIFN